MGSQQFREAPPPQVATPPAATCLAAAPYFCLTTSCISDWVLAWIFDSLMIASLGNLNDGFDGYGARTRAALFVEESENLAEGIRAGGVPEKGAFAAGLHEADLLELFQMMGKRGGGNFELVLKLAGDHSCRMRRKKKADDLKTGFGAERGKAVGGAGDEEGIGPGHISIIAEIQKYVKRNVSKPLARFEVEFVKSAPRGAEPRYKISGERKKGLTTLVLDLTAFLLLSKAVGLGASYRCSGTLPVVETGGHLF